MKITDLHIQNFKSIHDMHIPDIENALISGKREQKMSFQDEMKKMFLRVADGDVEPEEWGKW